MYADATLVDKNILYQGDIIADFPFYLFENNQPIKKSKTGYFELDGVTEETDRSLFAIEARKQNVMILSQTCDVQRRNNVIVCPVYDLKEFIKDNTINSDRAKEIRNRRIQYWFYLPEYTKLVESLADFQTMIYVPRTSIEKYTSSRFITFSDLGRHHLSWSLATYFGRPAE